ncbi:hypothetical protein Tco_0215000 [Tanacetum coccineum]
MASTRASISKASKRPKINIIPPKQLFVDLTHDDTKTSLPTLQLSSPSAPNAPSKTPSTKDTSSSSIDYIPKSPTSSTSLSPNSYLNPPTSPPPRVSPPPPTQENASMDITLTLSPITPLDVQFDSPSPSPPIVGHPIPWNLLEAHGDSCLSGKERLIRKNALDGKGRCNEKNEMDLFSVVHLSKPKLVTEGVRPLRDGEEPLLESTAGRTMELMLERPEAESTDVLAPTPLRSVPGAIVEPPRPDAASVGSSEDADVAEVDSGLKRKRATGDDGAGPSKRVRHVSLGLSTSTEEETPDASPTLAAKEVTETPPPNVEATSDSSAPVTHAVQSPPQTSPKVFEGMPVDQLMEEFDMVTAQQAALVAQLRARFSNERSQSAQKDEEIMLLKTQLADAQAEAESSRSYAQNLAEEKMALLVKEVKQSFRDVVKCALARGKAEEAVVEELHEKKIAAVACPHELPHIAQLERDQDYPIAGRGRNCSSYLAVRVTPCPFALEKEIPLKESLEAHAIRSG